MKKKINLFKIKISKPTKVEFYTKEGGRIKFLKAPRGISKPQIIEFYPNVMEKPKIKRKLPPIKIWKLKGLLP